MNEDRRSGLPTENPQVFGPPRQLGSCVGSPPRGGFAEATWPGMPEQAADGMRLMSHMGTAAASQRRYARRFTAGDMARARVVARSPTHHARRTGMPPSRRGDGAVAVRALRCGQTARGGRSSRSAEAEEKSTSSTRMVACACRESSLPRARRTASRSSSSGTPGASVGISGKAGA
jgi:hypothetical protein